jgi:hypothetical protein
MKKMHIILSASMTIVLLLAPAAHAATGVGLAVAGAGMSDGLRNDADIEQGGSNGYEVRGGGGSGGANAFANCQMAMLFNTIVANIAAAEGLGLVEDDDELNGRVLGLGGSGGYAPTYDNTTSTASCEHAIGDVLVAMDSAPGWGEPAPQESGVASIASSVAQNGLGGGATALGVGVAGADLEDILENDVVVSQGGGVNSASSCQLLVAWNTMIVNAGIASGSAAVHDNDTNGAPPELVPIELASIENGLENGHASPENEMQASTSSCRQSIESLTLVIGDTPTLPPES